MKNTAGLLTDEEEDRSFYLSRKAALPTAYFLALAFAIGFSKGKCQILNHQDFLFTLQ